MTHAFAQSIASLGNTQVLLLMGVGILVGLFAGLLPGVSSIVVMTVLLPLTYHMTAFEAFALLLGVYSVFVLTGDLTTILLGIPAHPECAAMVLDGYPMTRKGQGARALGAATSAAVIGALIGAAVLFVSIPVLKPLVIHLKTPELLALIVLGLMMVGTLSGQSVLKGIVGAGFGILLAMVGESQQTGIVRYGFGSLFLVDGLPLIPLALGMFAIPEMMYMHARGKSGIAQENAVLGQGLWSGMMESFKRPWLVLRGSLIGALPALLPGLGGAVGQWAAYGQAAQTSKHPELFGTGYIEGVIAPGAANNSKEGGQLVPTVAFGIPGGPAMAVLLAAFQLLGLQPGPQMLTTNLKITYFLIWIMVISHVIGAVFCLLLAKPMARIAFVPAGTLMPIVACLVLVGCVSDTITWANFVVMLVMGFAAYLMRKTGWSMAPVILGFVLGRSGETFVMQSYLVYGMSWLHWWDVDVILGLSILFAISTARRRRKNRRIQEATGGEKSQFTSMTFRSGTGLSITVSAAVTALGLAAGLDSLTWRQPNVAGTPGQATVWSFLGALLPLFASCVIVLFGSVETFLEIRLFRANRRKPEPEPVPVVEEPKVVVPVPQVALVGAMESAGDSSDVVRLATVMADTEDDDLELQEATAAVAPLSTRRSIEGFVWLIGAAVISYLLGFIIGLPLFTIVYLLRGKHKLWLSLVAGAIVAVGYWVIFVHLLSNTNLPFSLVFGPVWW